MSYYINLAAISLETFQLKLKEADLLPSRRLLKDKLDERFDFFRKLGLINVQDLQSALKKKNVFADFSKEELFDNEYLSVLLREINSMHPKPNKIDEFVGIPKTTVDVLHSFGIKDTVGLYSKVMTCNQRKELSIQTGISEDKIIELTKLCDLSRIRWVRAMFARVLYEVGFDTAEKVSKADFEVLNKLVSEHNKEKKLYKGNIGANDIKLSVNAAKEISFEIEY